MQYQHSGESLMGQEQETYLEAVIESMEQRKDDIEESAEVKEKYFKSRARAHNPSIPEGEIERFWNRNSHRVL